MIQWVPNQLEQLAWRQCAPPCLPPELVEYVANYLCDAYYEYSVLEKRYFDCLRWMSGTKRLTQRVDQVVKARQLPPERVAQEVLQLYLTHPMDILLNTQEEVMHWFNQITRKYEELK